MPCRGKIGTAFLWAVIFSGLIMLIIGIINTGNAEAAMKSLDTQHVGLNGLVVAGGITAAAGTVWWNMSRFLDKEARANPENFKGSRRKTSRGLGAVAFLFALAFFWFFIIQGMFGAGTGAITPILWTLFGGLAVFSISAILVKDIPDEFGCCSTNDDTIDDTYLGYHELPPLSADFLETPLSRDGKDVGTPEEYLELLEDEYHDATAERAHKLDGMIEDLRRDIGRAESRRRLALRTSPVLQRLLAEMHQ